MPLYIKDGKLLVKDGKLGTGQGCCCGGPCNPSTCPNGTECTPPCVCVDGQCVPPSGACCLPDGTCTDEYATQQQCEQCLADVFVCAAFRGLTFPDGPCPAGTSEIAPNVCADLSTVGAVNCGGETPEVYLIGSQPVGPCGTYHPGQTCAEEPCSDGCFEQALLGDEAYIDGWCANAASSVGFAGQPCELTTATCGARTLVNEYSPGFGDWIVTVCCDNPLP